jgi:predicted metal-dependent hydrolase
MQLDLFATPRRTARRSEPLLQAGGRPVPVQFVLHRRARRYVLRLQPDGSARVTIPRGGSLAEGRRFAQKHSSWIEKQLLRQAMRPVPARTWSLGTEILFRGETTRLEAGSDGEGSSVRFATENVAVPSLAGDLRPAVEEHLRALASRELPPRVFELAALHQLSARRVSVRDQRSRWGSCSRRGTISLNWRLVQAPNPVRDYVVLHELAHLVEMNHSRRFWRQVAKLCPEFVAAERWLKKHSGLLR